MKNFISVLCLVCLMLLVSVVTVSADSITEKKWVHDQNGWKYVTDGEAVLNQEGTINGKIYRFDKEGYVVTGIYTSGVYKYFYSVDGMNPEKGLGAKSKGLIKYKSFTYFFDSNYKMLKGWKTINNKKYYFGSNGYAVTGLNKISNKYYYFDKSGVMKTGWQTVSGKKYYFDKKGYAVTGLNKISNKYYYFDKSGVMKTGWQTVRGKKYYFDKKGYAVTGLKKLTGKYYYFDKKCVMKTGWQTENGNKYYFDKKGRAVTGINKISGKKYFFTTKGVMNTGWLKKNNKIYYFSDKGYAYTGLKEISGKKYYFGSSSVLEKGWKTINNKTYYFEKKGKLSKIGFAYTGLKTIGKNKYYFSDKGVLKTGIQTVKNKKYLFSSEGKVGTDLGAMLYGWQKTGDKICYAKSSGVLVVNSTYDGYEFTKKGYLTKQSSEVREKVVEIVAKKTKGIKKQSDKLYALYKYTYKSNKYKTLSLRYTDVRYAYEGLVNKKGNCLAFASEFAFLAREIGYKVKVVRGYCPYYSGGWTPHGWCEIVISGVIYTFDPDLQHELGINGYMKTYANAAISYKK